MTKVTLGTAQLVYETVSFRTRSVLLYETVSYTMRTASLASQPYPRRKERPWKPGPSSTPSGAGHPRRHARPAGRARLRGAAVDAVAARAKASKATLYRHWPGKAELVVDAVRCYEQAEPHRRGEHRQPARRRARHADRHARPDVRRAGPADGRPGRRGAEGPRVRARRAGLDARGQAGGHAAHAATGRSPGASCPPTPIRHCSTRSPRRSCSCGSSSTPSTSTTRSWST